ncbi:MAG: hypothetical protein KBD46_01650 [Candidatus Levybacteria bacterium]|nr:hypothetical protein [Candidatus Levybacteria bacterium]
MKKPILFIIVIITIVVSLSVTQVTVSNNLSTTGIELAKIEEQIMTYKKENAMLKEKLLTASSFTTIASAAAELGFVEVKTRVFLRKPPLAVR